MDSLANVKKRLEKAKEEKVRAEERLKQLLASKKEIEAELKEIGVEDPTDIKARIAEREKMLEAQIKKLDKVEAGDFEQITDPPDSDDKYPDENTVLKELGI